MCISVDTEVLALPSRRERVRRGQAASRTGSDRRSLRDHRTESARVVAVAPAYDHAEVTGVAASQVVYELLSAWGLPPGREASGT